MQVALDVRRVMLHLLLTLLLLILVVVAGMALAPGAAAQGGDHPNPNSTIVFQTVSGGPIYAINSSGNNLRYLTTGIDPALSPDGQWIAFTRWDDTQHGAFGSLWVINVDGTGERVIAGDVRQPKAPVWSPDGTQLAISVQHGGRLQPEQKCSHSLPADPVVDREDIQVVVEFDAGDAEVKYCYTLLPHPFWGLQMVDVVTGAFEDLPGDLFSYAPTWDPASDWRLVYDGDMGLVNMDLNQGTTWALTDDVRDHSPIFSPDGSRIAVSYWQHDHWEIHVINADGSGRVRLTQTPLRVIVNPLPQPLSLPGRGEYSLPRSWNNVAPAWSPDGSQIAFLTDRTGRWEMWVMSADGSNQRPLFPAGTLDGLALQYNNVDERMLSWR
jgi:TolB protein